MVEEGLQPLSPGLLCHRCCRCRCCHLLLDVTISAPQGVANSTAARRRALLQARTDNVTVYYDIGGVPSADSGSVATALNASTTIATFRSLLVQDGADCNACHGSFLMIHEPQRIYDISLGTILSHLSSAGQRSAVHVLPWEVKNCCRPIGRGRLSAQCVTFQCAARMAAPWQRHEGTAPAVAQTQTQLAKQVAKPDMTARPDASPMQGLDVTSLEQVATQALTMAHMILRVGLPQKGVCVLCRPGRD